MKDKIILVLGGTGHYGRHIVKSLLAKDVHVRVLTRNSVKAKRILGERPEFIEGDIQDPESIRTGLKGADGLVIAVSAFAPATIRQLKAIEQDAVIAALQAASELGVKRVVYISVFEVNREFALKYKLAAANEKAAVEEWLKGSTLNWTVLGAPPSMEIFFSMIRGSRMIVPGGGPEALPTISPADVGEIAAQASLRTDLSGKRLKMVGPDAPSFPGAAKRISAVWGKKIGFLKIPLILPMTIRPLIGLLSLFSKRLCFVYNLLGYVRLLNNFPQSYAAQVPNLHQELRLLFKYVPTTLEMEAEARKKV